MRIPQVVKYYSQGMNTSANASRNPRAGLTLIEILVVVTILAILATIVGINVLHEPEKARVITAKSQLKTLKTAVEIYKMDNGHIPTMAQGLAALVEKPTLDPIPKQFRTEGYLDTRAIPLDPWGNEYIYIVPGRSGESFEVISYGKDSEPGGTDGAADLSSSGP